MPEASRSQQQYVHHVGPTSMFVSCGPPTDEQLRAARRLRRVENGLANGATPVALETSQAARPPGTATAARQLLELVGWRPLPSIARRSTRFRVTYIRAAFCYWDSHRIRASVTGTRP